MLVLPRLCTPRWNDATAAQLITAGYGAGPVALAPRA